MRNVIIESERNTGHQGFQTLSTKRKYVISNVVKS